MDPFTCRVYKQWILFWWRSVIGLVETAQNSIYEPIIGGGGHNRIGIMQIYIYLYFYILYLHFCIYVYIFF